MKNISCSFFGHRNTELTDNQLNYLTNIIEQLITQNNVIYFLFGSRSSFYEICHKIITTLKKKYPMIKRIVYTCKSECFLVETKRKKLEDSLKKITSKDIHLLGYDGEYEYKTKYSAGKASYIERNYAMIDNSNFCIFFFNETYTPNSKKHHSSHQSKSGTLIAYKYAKQKNKTIINIFDYL